jgi:hypothetical protein
MKVDLTVTFNSDEILAMCAERVAKIETAVPGKFKLRHGLYGAREVVAEFVPDSETKAESPAGSEGE